MHLLSYARDDLSGGFEFYGAPTFSSNRDSRSSFSVSSVSSCSKTLLLDFQSGAPISMRPPNPARARGLPGLL